MRCGMVRFSTPRKLLSTLERFRGQHCEEASFYSERIRRERWRASLIRDRLFFFGHYEGIRIALPLVSQITLPTPAYQQYVLGAQATGVGRTRSPVRFFRPSLRRSLSTGICSPYCPHRAVPRFQLSDARLEQMAMAAASQRQSPR